MVKHEDEILDQFINFRVRRGTKAWLDEVADGYGLNTTTYIRLVLEQHERTPLTITFDRFKPRVKKRAAR